jgi:16S rRNA (guanine(966)-N(2))-methyltransferase RsmD
MLSGNRGKIRIIGGNWKRSVLEVPTVEGLRPTGDRQKETLFNWLSSRIEDFSVCRSLDPFAGTGALSFEAASRGFRQCVLFEKDRKAFSSIEKNIRKLHGEDVLIAHCGDSLASAKKIVSGFDVLFLDPPFALNLHEISLKTFLPLMKPGSYIYMEAPREIPREVFDTYRLLPLKSLKAGNTYLSLSYFAQETSENA